jgi:hypothetical protein
VDGTGMIDAVESRGEAYVYRFEANRANCDYLVKRIQSPSTRESTIAALGDRTRVAVIPQTVKLRRLRPKISVRRSPEVNLLRSMQRGFMLRKDS